MSQKVNGRCQCGSICYASDIEPVFAIHCYCRQCQRITGAGHASQFGLPASAVSIEGTLSAYKLKADSGNEVTSSFCPKCGSPICKSTSGMPDLLFFHAATLDAPGQFTAARNVWTSQKHAWDQLDEHLPSDP